MTTKKVEELLKQSAINYAIRIGRLILDDEESEEVYIKGVREVLRSLPERERQILWERYCLNKTLNEVATAIGVTRERIRQIESKTIRRLRNPTTIVQIKAVSLQSKNEAVHNLEAELNAGKNINNIPPIAVSDRLIVELELAVRDHNCLIRAGIRTVGELIGKTEDDLCRVRNLGWKGIEHIKERLASQGLSLKGGKE